MMRWISNGTTNLIGILNTAPAHTLDIINTTTTVNVLNLQSHAGTAVFTVADSGNTAITGGILTLMGPTTYVLNRTLAYFNYAVQSPQANTSYQNLIRVAETTDSGSHYYGCSIGGGCKYGASTFGTWNCENGGDDGNRIQIMKFIVDGSNNAYIGVNNALPAHCLDIVNSTTSQKILNLQSHAGASVMSVDNSGNTSASSITLTNTTGCSINLSTTYSSTPTANCLGYTLSQENASQVALTATVVAAVAQLTVPIGVWMLYGSASFQVAGAAVNVQTAISNSSSAFDDVNTVVSLFQTTSNGNNVCIAALPRYVCNSASTVYYVDAWIQGCAGTANATLYSTMRAVRIA